MNDEFRVKNIKQILLEIENSSKSLKELDYFLTHKDRYKFILEKIKTLNLPSNAKILDVGCFPPHLYQALEKLGYEVYGIGSVHEPINLKNIVNLNIEKEKLPFKNNFFDLV